MQGMPTSRVWQYSTHYTLTTPPPPPGPVVIILQMVIILQKAGMSNRLNLCKSKLVLDFYFKTQIRRSVKKNVPFKLDPIKNSSGWILLPFRPGRSETIYIYIVQKSLDSLYGKTNTLSLISRQIILTAIWESC